MTSDIEIPYRTNAEMIERFEEWAQTCEQANPEDINECFEEALSIMLEARLPRVDNEEDVKRLVQEALDDPRPGLSSEDAFAQIKQNSEQFHI